MHLYLFAWHFVFGLLYSSINHMTKNNQVIIAKVFSERYWNARKARKWKVAKECLETAVSMAHVLKEDNPKFDEERFMTACMLSLPNLLA